MQFAAKAPYIVETHLKITKVLDGDSLMVCSIFNSIEKEIRLYGIDAPEVKRNRKLKEDELKHGWQGNFLFI